MKIPKLKIVLSTYLAPVMGVVLFGVTILFLIFPGACERWFGITRGASFMLSMFTIGVLSLYANRKKIHALILRSFIGPFFVAFTVILFILVLQFMAKYMDDITGKGLGADVLGEVFGLACITTVTMALPLGVLLSSLLTMGNMGERYELAALKSGGVGLFKIIRPLTHTTLVITIASFFFAFYATPMANLKLYTLLYDLSRLKPTFALKANHFYSGIDGMVIHVGQIDRQTDILSSIRIYDHTQTVGNNSITVARQGRMTPSQSTGYLDLTLVHGCIFDFKGPEAAGVKTDQCQRFYFDTLHYAVPLDGFDLEKSDDDPFKTHQYMLDMIELVRTMDTLDMKRSNVMADYEDFNRKYVHLDTILNKSFREQMEIDSITYPPSGRVMMDVNKPVTQWFPDLQTSNLLETTINQCTALSNYTKVMEDRLNREDERIRKFEIELHTRIMLPMSCIVFLLLGASLGAIIRKGGIGIPVLFSIAFFILFYILMIQGKKFARDEIMSVWAGVWLPILVMLPMAILFTYQSATEAKFLYSVNWYKIGKFFWGPFVRKKKKENENQSMSVEEMMRLRQKYKDDARQRSDDHQKNQ